MLALRDRPRGGTVAHARAPAANVEGTGFLEAALAFAARDWPVFPLKPGEKVPLIAKAAGGNGCHDATTDLEQVQAWWTRWPGANIGLACGVAFWVLDFDPDKGGSETMARLRDEVGPLPGTVFSRTGSGGHHCLFRADRRITNATGI